MANTVQLNHQNFKSEVLESSTPVLVDFWASWCMPCKMLAPILEDLAEEMQGKVKIAKLNTEEPDHQELAQKYQIQSIPNLKLFKNGEVVAEFVGLKPKETLKEEIESYL